MFYHVMLKIFQRYARRYFQRHPEVKLVIVAGSIGKTTVKRAIGTVLSEKMRVRMHERELASPLGVYLSIFGLEVPKHATVFYWFRAWRAVRYQLKNPPIVDVIVQELVLAGKNSILDYEVFLNPDIAVITSVVAGVDDVYQPLDAVAVEELAATEIARYVLINRDDIASEYAQFEKNPNFNTYGTSGSAEYRVEMDDLDKLHNIPAHLVAPEITGSLQLEVNLVGEHQMRPLAAAAAVGLKLGLDDAEISRGLSRVTPLAGRLQPLRGLDRTVVLDDSWSIDPNSLVADLQTLYQFSDASQLIAVVGSMNNLGGTAEEAYQTVSEALNGSVLTWLVTVGANSAKYMAPLARKRGCQVKECADAIEAAEFVRSVSGADAVILVKGGADDLLEEAVKVLVDTSEHPRLVRQSPEWLARNQEVFSRFTGE